jgi:hypothetical protein
MHLNMHLLLPPSSSIDKACHVPTACDAALCRYNRLYTLTAQCMEGDVAAYESALRGVLQSFVPPAAAA